MEIMKFFTPLWRDGELSDEDYDGACRGYDNRLTEIRRSLSDDLVRFLDAISLHDAKIRSASLDLDRTFRLAVRAGDLQSGYVDVDLEYGDIQILEGNPSAAVVLNSDDGEIIQDEIDLINEGVYEHRLLFAPDGELLIRFRRFKFGVTSVRSRSFERSRPVFRQQSRQ